MVAAWLVIAAVIVVIEYMSIGGIVTAINHPLATVERDLALFVVLALLWPLWLGIAIVVVVGLVTTSFSLTLKTKPKKKNTDRLDVW